MSMKKIIHVEKQSNGKLLIKEDSYPLECTPELIADIKDREDIILVDSSFEFPYSIPGKKRFVYWNPEKEVAEVEYVDKTFDEMDAYEQNACLRAENASLREELELTQSALFELHAMVVGGNEDGSN